MAERIYEFNWDIVGDLQEGRPNLGDKVNFVLYRLMQYTFLDTVAKRFSTDETNIIFRDAGNIAGRFFFDNMLTDYKGLSVDDFLGKLRAVLDDNGLCFIRIDSIDIDSQGYCISVATGIEGVGKEVFPLTDYQYDMGFVEGILFKFTGKEFLPITVNADTDPSIFPKMGSQINLIPYRILQYTARDVLEQRIGTDACNQLFYDAGDLAGRILYDNFLLEYKDLPLNGFFAELQRILKEFGVGILRIEKSDVDNGQFTLTVSEDLDCSGLPDLGIEVCNYDEGFIAGVFYKFTGVTFNVKEVDCWCSGDRTCRFNVNRT